MNDLLQNVIRVADKLFKLQKADVPEFFTKGIATAAQLARLGIYIFLGILLAELVVLLVRRAWKQAAVFGATAACVGGLAVFAVPYLSTLL